MEDSLKIKSKAENLAILENNTNYVLLQKALRKDYLEKSIKDKKAYGLGEAEVTKNKFELVQVDIDIKTLETYLKKIIEMKGEVEKNGKAK